MFKLVWSIIMMLLKLVPDWQSLALKEKSAYRDEIASLHEEQVKLQKVKDNIEKHCAELTNDIVRRQKRLEYLAVQEGLIENKIAEKQKSLEDKIDELEKMDDDAVFDTALDRVN